MSGSEAAQRYAEALMAVADEQNTVSAVDADMRLIADCLSRAPGLFDRLAGPALSQSQRRAAVDQAFEGAVGAHTLRLLRLLVEHRRLGLLAEIPAAFAALLDRRAHVVDAVVTSARALSAEQRTKIVRRLERRIGGTVRAKFTVDQTLLAGFRIVYNDTLIDTSTAGALTRLRERLLSKAVSE